MARAPHDRPAPAALEVIRAFVNTRNFDTGTDELADAGAASDWFNRLGLGDVREPLSDVELEWVVEVREAFRAALVANAEGSEIDEPVAVLNDLAGRGGLALRLTSSARAAPIVTPGGGVTSALAHLLAVAVEAMFADTWTRLKACPAPTCHWAFYDRSRNRTARWCDMGLCGSRAKRDAQRRRARTRATGRSGAAPGRSDM